MFKSVKTIVVAILIGSLEVSSAMVSPKADAMMAIVKCYHHQVSVDGGATWGTSESCEVVGYTGGGGPHPDDQHEEVTWGDNRYFIDGLQVDRTTALMRCAKNAQNVAGQCKDFAAYGSAGVTTACTIAGGLTALSGGTLFAIAVGMCAGGIVIGTHEAMKYCENKEQEALNKCMQL